MMTSGEFRFGEYRLSMPDGQLASANGVVTLPPKATSVLHHLCSRPGRIVTKEELLETAWRGVVVSDGVVSVCINSLRKALGDDARQPRFIETVHRRGYRFVAPVEHTTDLGRPEAARRKHAPAMVGRERELMQLQDCHERALSGQRQVIFVTGDTGMGKTTLLAAFAAHYAPDRAVYGQCVEQYGAKEAYLPILEVLGRLARAPDGDALTAHLRRVAPSWLAQMPSLVEESEHGALRERSEGATPERMLGELADVLESYTAERPVVLLLEDLHWSDQATVQALAMLARRQEPARLMVVGTYRPVELILRDHVLRGVKQELVSHHHAVELPVGYLDASATTEYLRNRIPQGGTSAELAALVHRHTDGHPLFLANVVDYLERADVDPRTRAEDLARMVDVVPERLAQFIDEQVDALPADEQALLEAASVKGAEFSVAAVASAQGAAVDDVEVQCERLARRGQFIEAWGLAEWPDGTLSGRYRFRHALYQTVLYERIGEARRVRLHRAIGEREEAAYGERVEKIATELAMHFEHGGDSRRAVRYLQIAAGTATRRAAHQEAILLLERALDLVRPWPETPERAETEVGMQIALSAAYTSTRGWAAHEVEAACERARALVRQVGDPALAFRVLTSLRVFYLVRGRLLRCRQVAQQQLDLAGSDGARRMSAHRGMGMVLFPLGELVEARDHLERSIGLYDLDRDHPAVSGMPQDERMTSQSFLSWALWMLGHPDHAAHLAQDTVAWAKTLSHSFSLAFAVYAAAKVHLLRGEYEAAERGAREMIALGREYDFTTFSCEGEAFRGAALLGQGRREEGIDRLRTGVDGYRTTQGCLEVPYYLSLLAEGYLATGRPDMGLTALEDAFLIVEENQERSFEAELHRLKGELLLARSGASSAAAGEAETCFERALAVARVQSAKSLELRAAMSLARSWCDQGKRAAARDLLAPVYGWFTEGFETADLRDAKALREELA